MKHLCTLKGAASEWLADSDCRVRDGCRGGRVRRSDGPYPEQSHSLLGISNPNVVLWALKPAEDGIAAGAIASGTWLRRRLVSPSA